LKQTQQSGWKAVHEFIISVPSFSDRTCIHCLKVRFTPNALEPLRNCVSARRVFVRGWLRWMTLRLKREVWSRGVGDCRGREAAPSARSHMMNAMASKEHP
jgi:hypothetical protein